MTILRSTAVALTLIASATALPAFAENIEAGPIWNQGHANQVCPAVAQAHGGEWTGHWWTTIPNEMSVCQVQMPARTVEAGPIWNQEVCPAIAHSHGAEWTGHWWTTVWNEMSVCQIR